MDEAYLESAKTPTEKKSPPLNDSANDGQKKELIEGWNDFEFFAKIFWQGKGWGDPAKRLCR